MLIIMTTAITYTTFSMNQVTQLAESVETKQVTDFERTAEKFEVVKVRTDNNQFNMTVKNTGSAPVHLTRLWVENSTDSDWPISKYDLDISIPPGGSVKNIGQNIGLTALDTQSYQTQLITERGNSKEMFLNSVGDSSLFMRLTATPSVMPTTFHSTITLEIINTGTTQLLNLQPDMISVVPSTCTGCVYVEEQDAIPSSFDSLSPGDTAIFEWIYSFSGENGDQLDFVAGLVNSDYTDSVSVTLQTIESALNANVAIESGGLGDQVLIDDDILLFHLENDATPSGEYQMWSGIGDGGNDGLRIQLDQTIPHIMTNNGSSPITIPAGQWDIAMMLNSEPVPNSLKHTGATKHDLIYHFEDGDNQNPVNSEGQSNRDLEVCGTTNYSQSIAAASDDAEEKVSDGKIQSLTDHDLDFSEDHANKPYIVGMRFTGINVDQGTTLNTASIQMESDESDSALVNLRIYAELSDDASTFTTSNDDISDRPYDPAEYVDWDNIPAWSTGEVSPDTKTPDLTPILQEIIDRPGWVSGNDVVLLFYDNGGDGGQRAARSRDGSGLTPTLSITWGNGAIPDWQAQSGPHSSGSFYFDGESQCFRSNDIVDDARGNRIDDLDNTTTLWFKTDGVASTEQYLVDWSESTCPACDFYRIGLTSIGKVFFEYSGTDNGVSVVRCESLNEYDDSEWHHVVAARDYSTDQCWLYLKDTLGDDEETRITENESFGGDDHIHPEGKWHVASNWDEDDKFFKGWIDDIMHWNEYKMDAFESDDIARTNYGNGAHSFDVTLDVTDAQGVFLRNLYTGISQDTLFADSMDRGDNDDLAYSQTNMTFNLLETVVGENERLELYFDWLSTDGSNWEPLEVDMKIDDTSMNNPYPSFMQIPFPDRAFPSYYVHDNDDEFQIIVSNSGNDGVFFTYQGTRVNFNGTAGAYAGLIHSANGTGGGANDWWNMDEDRDSLYVPPGENVRLYFHEATDVPNTDENIGDKPPVGAYRTTIWLNGYSDQGETFSRSVVVGSVTMEE